MDDNNQTQTTDGDATGTNSGDGQGLEKKFTQADIDRIVEERLGRAARKAEETQRKAEETAAANALKEQGEFKTLAEKHAIRISELEKQAEEIEAMKLKSAAYEELIKKQVEAQMKSLPEIFKSLLVRMTPTEQLDWLSANAEKLRVTGVPQTTKPSGAMGDAATEKARKDFERMIRAL